MANLNDNIKIAGDLTVLEWIELVPKLENGQEWETGVDFFRTRFDERFINPIKLILKDDKNTGEGFTAMAIICLLLETLQAFKEGAIYCYPKYNLPNGTSTSSSSLIRKFLRNQEPFRSQLNSKDTDDFFTDVRCGLLHEARTKSDWIIRSKKEGYENILFEKNDSSIILYRTVFFKFLVKAKEDYENKLLSGKDENLRENFLIKFNEICSK